MFRTDRRRRWAAARDGVRCRRSRFRPELGAAGGAEPVEPRILLSARAAKVVDRGGNSPRAATDLGAVEPGRSVALGDALSRRDRNDYFRFRVATPTVVQGTITGLRARTRLQLLDASGRPLLTANGTRQAGFRSVLLAPGTYLARVARVGGSGTKYRLALADVTVRNGPAEPPPAIPTNPTAPPPPPTPPTNPEPRPAQTINRGDGIVYVPSGLVAGWRYPLLVAYNPGGDAQGSLNYLKSQAEQRKFILYSSRYYRNGGPGVTPPTIEVARTHLDRVLAEQPVDPTRVILTGFSGGGSFAHAMSLGYPGLVDALVINTAMVWGPEVPDTGTNNGPDWYNYAAGNASALAGQFAGSSRRLVVFLASPGDFRYEEMQRDERLLRALGWRTRWIEFSGGHTIAPQATYRAAFDWIVGQAEWA